MKRKISILIAFIMMLSMVSPAFAETRPSFDISEIVLPGVEYYDGMPDIETEEQMDYEVKLSSISVKNGEFSFEADVSRNGEFVEAFSAAGGLFNSEVLYYKERNVITAALSSPDDTVVLSCMIQPNTNPELLFPVCSTLEGKNSILLLIMIEDGTVLNFIGEVPETFDFNVIQQNIMTADDEEEFYPEDTEIGKIIDENETEQVGIASRGVMEEEEEETITEADVIMQENNYHMFGKINSIVEEEEEVKIADADSRTRAVSPIPCIPVNVFTTPGKWASTNNPNYQMKGYYADTTVIGGNSSSRYVDFVQWEYGYNGPADIKAKGDIVEATSWIKVEKAGTYHYNGSTGKITIFSLSPQYRLKSGTVLMGLKSDQQIVKATKTHSVCRDSKISVNWQQYTGLIPAGKTFNTAYNLFTATRYQEVKMGAKSPSNYTIETYHDTIAKQKTSYGGDLVKAGKIGCNGTYISEPNDHYTLRLEIVQPRDGTYTKKYETVHSKYYFEVWDKDIWGLFNNRIYNVTEYRDVGYYVR